VFSKKKEARAHAPAAQLNMAIAAMVTLFLKVEIFFIFEFFWIVTD